MEVPVIPGLDVSEKLQFHDIILLLIRRRTRITNYLLKYMPQSHSGTVSLSLGRELNLAAPITL